MTSLENLFRDYEVQVEAQRMLDYEYDAQELRALELSKVTLLDRLAAQRGQRLTVHGSTGDIWRGQLVDLGLGWVHLSTESGEVLVPTSQLIWWEGGDYKSELAGSSVTRKLTFASALRALAAGRREVQIVHTSAPGLMSEGLVVAVGADYCDLLLISGRQLGQQAGRGQVRSLPLGSVAAIRIRN